MNWIQPVLDYPNDPIWSLKSERRGDRMFLAINANLFEIVDNELWETDLTPRPSND